MHIGLIGGIGPAATLVYYDRLTRRVRAAGGRLELTIVQASVDELIANVIADRRDDQARVYAVLIDRLRAAGAACAAITSLGGHFCFPETVGDLVAAAGQRHRAARRALRRSRAAAGRAARHRGRDAHPAVRAARADRGGRAGHGPGCARAAVPVDRDRRDVHRRAAGDADRGGAANGRGPGCRGGRPRRHGPGPGVRRERGPGLPGDRRARRPRRSCSRTSRSTGRPSQPDPPSRRCVPAPNGAIKNLP